MNKREFLQLLAAASIAGCAVNDKKIIAGGDAKFYDVPRFGNVHFLHFTDCHAQLQPIYFREPNVNIGLSSALNKPPHLVGAAALAAYGIAPNSRAAHAFTHLDFSAAAKRYGKVGGFAHMATLVKQLRESRPGALLLDGGDTWQGSGTALWTSGQDMVDACLALGVDIMTGHWEFTLGAERVKQIVERDFKGKIEFIAQNIKTTDFGDEVFPGYTLREVNGVKIAIIGQAFPYTPIANPRYLVPEWTFGIQEEAMQKVIDDVRSKGATVVVLLSHNGADVDLKLASKVRGLDAILGGHTHDGIPAAQIVTNAGGETIVTNAGSNGKFLGVLDFNVVNGKIAGTQYKLLPIFSDLLPADAAMNALITKIRAPYDAKLSEELAVTDGLLFRRGNFNGSFDQVILDALLAEKNAQIAFSPGFRWGTSILPGQAITREHLMDQTAISYPFTTVSNVNGAQIKIILEDIADNLFNPDPYYQQGGDMVRVGGMTYTLNPLASVGNRISEMRIGDTLIDANKNYKLAGWAPVSEDAKNAGGEAIWDLMERYLRAKKTIAPQVVQRPKLVGMTENLGMAL